MENKKKRYYKEDEVVWIVHLKKEGIVKSVNKEKTPITMTVSYSTDSGETKDYTEEIWKFDKLKYAKKEKQVEEETDLKKLASLLNRLFYPEIFMAKVREGAVLLSKEKEDAGYDVYAELSEFAVETHDGEGFIYEIECPVLATTLVPTGLAVALPDTHYLNLKHERGSTGVQSMGVLAGVIDSGFRNEMFLALTPMKKTIVITSRVSKVEEDELKIYYPLSKGIAQGTIDIVPEAKLTETDLATLQSIPSKRGMGMLGSSGK